MKKRKLIWERGYDWIVRIGKQSISEYSITECRIAAMAYEAGYKARIRDERKKNGLKS